MDAGKSLLPRRSSETLSLDQHPFRSPALHPDNASTLDAAQCVAAISHKSYPSSRGASLSNASTINTLDSEDGSFSR